jgi:hypothetical protein
MIKRKAPLRRTLKPIARNCKPRARRPGKPRRGPANIPAEEWRNRKYLQFLRDECRCIACVAEARSHSVLTTESVTDALKAVLGYCEPMHGPPNGKSQKGPDAGAIPGCREHHEEQTRIGWPAFEDKYGIKREREAAGLFETFWIASGYR